MPATRCHDQAAGSRIRRGRRLLLAGFCATVFLPWPGNAQPAGQAGSTAVDSGFAATGIRAGELGEVLRIAGTVKLSREGGSESRVTPGNPISAGMTIRTGMGGWVEIRFDQDGKLVLRPSSLATINAPAKASGPETADCPETADSPRQLAATVRLHRGTLQLDHHPEALNPRVVNVNTPDAAVCLRGTTVRVHVDPDQETSVIVMSGEATVGSTHGGKPVILKDCTGTLVRKGQPPWPGFSVDFAPCTGLSASPPLEAHSELIFHDSPFFDSVKP